MLHDYLNNRVVPRMITRSHHHCRTILTIDRGPLSSQAITQSGPSMSTAIALRTISPGSGSDKPHLRQRNLSTSPPKSSEILTHDTWLDGPHDVASSDLPLDLRPFHPTNIYWISPHGLLSKKVTILDLTKDIDVPYTGLTAEYKREVRKTLKDHSFTPVITCHRNNWLGLQYKITDDQDDMLATWSHPWSSVGEATLTFPDSSPHSPHPISLRNKRWGCRTELFVLNSVPYFWESNSIWHSTNMTLYKIMGSGEAEKKVELAKYAQRCYGGFVTGGTLVVNEEELDGVLACLTLMVVLKKKRQRAAERRNGEG